MKVGRAYPQVCVESESEAMYFKRLKSATWKGLSPGVRRNGSLKIYTFDLLSTPLWQAVMDVNFNMKYKSSFEIKIW